MERELSAVSEFRPGRIERMYSEIRKEKIDRDEGSRRKHGFERAARD
jgi:hypothetical protein